MVRALYGGFDGALYRVIRSIDNSTKDIPVLAAGGYANSAVQDAFCAGSDCVVTHIFDQSPNGNDLSIFHRADSTSETATPAQDKGVNASRDRHMLGGHP